jgi:hypothetical protein
MGMNISDVSLRIQQTFELEHRQQAWNAPALSKILVLQELVSP